ncbi:hypothetical protein L596_003751 [Steinernema carpocapsae]|uniref:Sodium/hydrogen exchanger n=1 Tax=Steinernema carpocapsae TaxID=34508 RepID=A0A4U8UV80_STECR|nr:hypothetical protein L596_003751 [Steinernema carpocapsae]
MCFGAKCVLVFVVFLCLLQPSIGNLSEDGYDKAGNKSGRHISVIHMNFHHVDLPLKIILWFVVITMAKTVVLRVSWIAQYTPESAFQLALGLVCGVAFHWYDPTEEVYLKPDWFFLYLLPPIVLDAGYFLPNKDFFPNIGTILVYAVFGTLWNIGMTGLTLYAFSSYFTAKMSLIDLMLFSTLISAVDPVAVIGVFERLHVNSLLHICVFGESLLNDVVTVVLYKSLSMMSEVGVQNMTTLDYAASAGSFGFVSFFGIFIGIVAGMLTTLMTKYAQIDPLQPLILLMFPYLSYLVSEGFGQSGILTLAVCGLVMRQYVHGNMDKKSLIATANSFKMLSSRYFCPLSTIHMFFSCEAMIFIFLGVSVISAKHQWDPVFIAVTAVSCFVYRFIGVGILTYLVNKRRVNRISRVNQFIMGYGGLRGAICYGLVMSIDESVIPCKNIFFTTTIVVILQTVFLQGLTIKPFVKSLHVRLEDPRKNILMESINDQVTNDLMVGIEVLVGYHGLYRITKEFENFNDRYLKKFLMLRHPTPAHKLVRKYEDIQLKEARKHIRAHGSFAGLPNVSSQTAIGLPSSRSEIISHRLQPEAQTEEPKQEMPRFPRNQSLSVLLRDEFAKANGPEHGTYSRHFLGYENQGLPAILLDALERRNEDKTTVDMNYMTYPYSRDKQLQSFLASMRTRENEKRKKVVPKASEIFGPGGTPNNRTKFTIGQPEEVEMTAVPPKVEFNVGGPNEETRLLMPIDEEDQDCDDVISESSAE